MHTTPLESTREPLRQVRLLAVQDVALDGAGLLCAVVEGEADGALDIVVPAAAQGAVRADNDGLAAPGELDRRELLLVVFLEGRAQLVDQVRGRAGQGFDVCGKGGVGQVMLSCRGALWAWDGMPAITSASWEGAAC